jgi:hypothetical protein
MTSLPAALTSTVAGTSNDVLTVYLNTNQAEPVNLNRAFETNLASRLKELGQTFDQNQAREEFAAAAAHVQGFVAGYKPVNRSLVVFASSTGILLSRGLQVDVETEVYWGRPHIKPYVEALDEFERHIVVATDKWQARLLSLSLGTVETAVEVHDDPRTTHIQTAGMDHLESQAQFQRGADERMKKHLRHVVRELQSLLKTHPSNRVILGGNVEAVAELFRLLPKPLRSKVVDTISLSMIDSVEQLLRTGLQAQLNAERNFELDAVERLQVAAGKENKAVVGTVDTLKALGEGRILSLFYADNFTASGKECTSCHALFTEDAPARCAYCNKPLKPLEGLLDAMLLKALAMGSRVEQVRGKGAEKLRESGGIGAFLRY